MSISWCNNPGMALGERREGDTGLAEHRRRLVLRYMVDAETAARTEGLAVETELRPAPPSATPPPMSTRIARQRARTAARAADRLLGRAARWAAHRSVEAITSAIRSIVSAARGFDRPDADTGDLVLVVIVLSLSVGIGVAVASVL
jgi:hypothetical protein